MSENTANTLLERIEKTPYSVYPATSVLIPFYDHSVHLKLSYEAALNVGRHGGDDLLMIVDNHTATQSRWLTELCHLAQRVVVLGEKPKAWVNFENVSASAANDTFLPGDHVLILISTSVHIAILGSIENSEALHDDESVFYGGWTIQRAYVMHAVEALLKDEGQRLIETMRPPEEGLPLMATISMRLMTLHANALANRQEDITADRKDLFSVLNILKAISAKRRAHDILFVFVEQIARIVNSERCSVVRVWGSERFGHVVASHEDSRLTDQSIDLEKYPELLKAMNTREKVIVNDVHTDPLTTHFADVLQHANINSILVIPIVLFDENIGSLFLRAARSKGSFSLREISFFEIVTNAASNALERAHLFETIQIANENLERLAVTDGLTGLYNHRFFRDRLNQEVERALRYRIPLACMIFDVDDFKAVNDTYGHLAGDEVLREIAQRTEHSVRKSDICARYGGEEFVVIMPQTGSEGGLVQAERIREIVASGAFHCLPLGASVTVSVGVGVLDPDRMLMPEDLLRAADQALYSAKRSGKNRVMESK